MKKTYYARAILAVSSILSYSSGTCASPMEAALSSTQVEQFMSGFTISLGVGASAGSARVRGYGDYSFPQMYTGVVRDTVTGTATAYQRQLLGQYGPEGTPPHQIFYAYYHVGDIRQRYGFVGVTGIVVANFTCKIRNSPLCAGVGCEGGLMDNKVRIPYCRNMATQLLPNGTPPPPPPFSNLSGVVPRFSEAFRMTLMNYGYVGASWNIGVAVDRAHFYVKVGWSMHHWTAKLINIDDPIVPQNEHTALPKKRKWINCVMVGGGMDFPVTPNAMLTLESTFHMGRGKKVGFSIQPSHLEDTPLNVIRRRADSDPSIKITPFTAITTLQFKLRVSHCKR